MDYKSLPSFVKDITGRTVTGFASVFGNVDSYGDIVHRGAFKKTIAENAARVKHLWQHDFTQPPIAAVRDLKEVKRDELPPDVQEKYPEATGGLLVVREYLDTPRGTEVLEAIRAGAINEMSFAYDPVKYDFGEITEGELKLRVRNLREVKLFDVSDVVWGANPATVASKGLEFCRAEYLLSELTALKSGRVLSSRNLEKLKNALNVLSEILLTAEPPEDDESKLLALTEQLRRRTIAAQLDIESYLIGV